MTNAKSTVPRASLFTALIGSTIIGIGSALTGCVVDSVMDGMVTPPGDTGSETGAHESTSGGESTSNDEPSTSSSPSDTEDTGPSHEGSVCEQFCKGGCLLGEEVQECLAHCEELLSDEWGAECSETALDWMQCMIEADCVLLECWEEDEALEESCNCEVGGGGSIDGSQCDVEVACHGQQATLECVGESCACIVDGRTISCDPLPGFCLDPFGPDGVVYIEDCCGVTLPF